MLLNAIRSLTAAALLVAGGVAAQAKDITFTTDFGFNGRHAYFYVALDKGYYKAEGLDVTIINGKGSSDAIKKVASGTADIGFADAGALVLARGNDGVPVKLVSIVYATSPHALYALADSGIATPKDLEGKKVADSAYSAMPLLFPAYAKAAGIDASKVEWITADGSALPALLARGQVDVIGQYIVGEPLLEKAVAPGKLVRLGYADAGLDYYGNGLVASEAMIKRDPETVKAFVRATYKGLADALANPEAAGKIMHKYQKQVTVPIAEGETKKVGELVRDYDGKTGAIDPAEMAKTVAVVEGAYKLANPVKPEDVYVPGFVE